MAVGWMFYMVLVSALLLGAGFLLERGARTLALPQRLGWAAVFGGSIGVPALVPRGSGAAGAGRPGDGVLLGELSTLAAGGAASPSRLPIDLPAFADALALGLWVGASGVLAVLAAISLLRLRRRMSTWEPQSSASRRILVSEQEGPAVVGWVRPAIVLPRWAWEGDGGVRRLILAHEEEHLRARDPILLLIAGVVLVLLPWNLPLWWQLRRLRLAVEVDCDARVLRRGSDLHGYASLLLEVGRRRAGLAPALLALAEPRSFLERRLRLMLSRRPGRRWPPALACTVLASALVAGACAVDPPSGADDAGVTTPTRPATSDTATRPGAAPAPGAVRSVAERGDTLPPAAPADPVRPSASAERAPTPRNGDPDAADGADAAGAAAQSGNRATPIPTLQPERSLISAPAFSPREVEPTLLNRRAFGAALDDAYPAALREAGLGGRVLLWIFVTEEGEVGSVQLYESSGRAELDAAAQSVMLEVAEFSPAENDGQPVPVWIALPVTFQVAEP